MCKLLAAALLMGTIVAGASSVVSERDDDSVAGVRPVAPERDEESVAGVRPVTANRVCAGAPVRSVGTAVRSATRSRVAVGQRGQDDNRRHQYEHADEHLGDPAEVSAPAA